ncbi:MAG: ferredoxin--nitrite reductase [Candidatus Marinimicrobia bacterium]|nr:ferredoxin--nitrite reductase [Candidatus Neomarinimicrobiota bacterium]MCF7829755.1 ferredoxin--nitrite reductase [Candidatus Neomarinimicrobiota bacterium]MCF7881705.1 ferredoxin--nitrite reductase [Candidatus Neomarinimicrobiota bacterium]
MGNKVEELKQKKNPLEIADTIKEVYAKEGYDAITDPDEPERLKWYGLYTHNDKTEGYFMMRIKVPGGVLKPGQARRIGEVINAYAVGEFANPHFGDAFGDVTTRQDIQMHWIDIRDVPEIWELLGEVDIPTGVTGACGDVPRNVVGCPVAGLDKHEIINGQDLVEEVTDFFLGNEEFSNLPRKYKIAISGCRERCGQGEINDIGLYPAQKSMNGKEEYGFNVIAGGGLGRKEILAKGLNVFLTRDQVVEFNRAAATVFRDQGNRKRRGRARLRYLLDEKGADWFREEIQNEANFTLQESGESLEASSQYNDGRYYRDHIGLHEQKNGNYYAGLHVPTGRFKGDWFIEAANLSDEYGNGEIRLTQRQNIIIPDIPEERLDTFQTESLLERLQLAPSPLRRGSITCTGTEFCSLALIETKNRMVKWIEELEQRLDTESPIRLHLSGCNASCAQPQIADIAFQGMKARKDGDTVEAVDIGLGGGLGDNPGFAEWVLKRVPCEDAFDVVSAIVEQYEDRKQNGESFREYVWRVNPENAVPDLDILNQ